MTRVAFRQILLLIAATFSIDVARAQSDRMLYELQERCGKQAAQTFEKEWGANAVGPKRAHVTANYESHYSPRLDKCFYLEVSTTVPRAAIDKTNFNTLRLYDLNENKQYGTFVEAAPLHVCKVQDTPCSSEAEWRALVKSFMEE